MSSPLAELLEGLSSAFADLGLRWYLFGAQAAIVYGAARLTADVDVTVDPAETPVRALLDALARSGFEARVADAEELAGRARVLPVVHASTQMPVDVVLAGPGLEERFFERARRLDVAGVEVPVVAAEDLLVMKILAGRPKDDEDAAAILAAREGSLDVDSIEATLRLLEEALDRSDLIARLRALLAAAGSGA